MTDRAVFAVLTGDVVQSTKLAARDLAAAREAIAYALGEARAWRRGAFKGAPEFFRGDSFQALMAAPGLSLRAALFVRARLIAETGADCRIAIGLGAVESVSRTRVSLSRGEAFVASGRALDKLSAGRLAIHAGEAFAEGLGPLAPLLPAYAGLADALVSGWTRRQAEVACAALALPARTQDAIAASMKVTKQAVSKTLDAAHWRALDAALAAFESAGWGA